MRNPTLLVPYPGPDPSGDTFDCYVYLRPETNGVVTESIIMKTIVEHPLWKKAVHLVYMANYPGDFIRTRHLIEHHYRVKIVFARAGGRAFTPGMRRDFESKFGDKFDPRFVLGAFEALGVIGLDEEDLFSYRVNEDEMLITLGQNVKRYGDYWIVNYDMPAILHRNTFETDIAVMVFRSTLEWREFRRLIAAMSGHLVEAGVVGANTAPSRVFHHSKSPWEQLLDGIDFLWGIDLTDGGAEDDISFGAYMMARGHSRRELQDAIRRPLFTYVDDKGSEKEGNLFEMSAGMTYPRAEELLTRIIGTFELPDLRFIPPA